MNNHIRIKLRNTVFTYCDYKDARESLTGLLSHAYAEGLRATCLCSSNLPALYITNRFGTYYLARMPETGSFHDAQCAFYESPSADSGRGAYAEGAIVDRGDYFDVKLGVPLTHNRDVDATPKADRAKPTIPTTRRHAVELLGMLHFFWEQSNNHRWFPVLRGKAVLTRHWRNVVYFVHELLGKVHCKNVGIEQNIFVIPAFDRNNPNAIDIAFLEKMKNVIASGSEKAAKNKEKIEMKMVLGEVKSISKTTYGQELKFKGFNQSFYVRDSLFQKVKKSYSLGISAISPDNDTRCIALAVVAASRNGYFNIESMALMPTTSHYIPYDSSYELRIANMLVSQQRQFEKPLRYDNLALTLPDFILLDAIAAPRIPLEIYGMTGNVEYDKRKADKKEIYRKLASSCWEWEPEVCKIPPAFPLPIVYGNT